MGNEKWRKRKRGTIIGKIKITRNEKEEKIHWEREKKSYSGGGGRFWNVINPCDRLERQCLIIGITLRIFSLTFKYVNFVFGIYEQRKITSEIP
jgi:hypothetical protein